jgi:hypothetical protein
VARREVVGARLGQHDVGEDAVEQGPGLIVLLVVFALLAGAGGYFWMRRSRDSRPSGEIVSRPASGSPEPTPVDTLLVLLDDPEFPDTYLALGPVTELQALEREGMVQRVGSSVATANVAVQALQGYREAAELVKLSPETVSHIRNGARLIKGSDGYNIGVLRDATSNDFLAQVRWTKAGSGLATLAALGNAATMAIIQMQLDAISGQIERVGVSVDRLAASYQFSVDGDLRGTVRAVREAQQRALETGVVTDRQIGSIQGFDRDLDAHIERLESECGSALRRLSRVNSQQERLKWLQDDGHRVLKSLSELMEASRAWTANKLLYAANLMAPGTAGAATEAADRLASRLVVQQTRERIIQVDRTIAELVYEYVRALELAAVTKGRLTLSERVQDRVINMNLSEKGVRDLAVALRTQLDGAGIAVPDFPAISSGVRHIGTLGADSTPQWIDVLALMLAPDESVQAIVHGRGAGGNHNVSSQPSALVITDQRLIGLRKQRFVEDGRREFTLPIRSVRGVAASTAYGDPVLRITVLEGRLGVLGGKYVDLEMLKSEIPVAVAAVEAALSGQVTYRPLGPSFDEQVRRLDGGLRQPLAIEARRPSPSAEMGTGLEQGY